MKILLLIVISFLQTVVIAQTWTAKKELNEPVEMGVSFSINNKVYVSTGQVGGGSGGSKNTWEYDLLTNLWKEVSNVPSDNIRTGAFGFAINDKGYVGGGTTDFWNGLTLNDFWEYDPSIDQWFEKSPLTSGTGRTDASSFVIDGKGYVVFGTKKKDWGDPYIYDNTLMMYDPSTDNWVKKGDVPLSSIAPTIEGITEAGTFVLGDEAYFVGGKVTESSTGNQGLSKQVLHYNATNNTWSSLVNALPHPRAGMTAFSIDGRGYAVGGYTITVNGEPSENVFRYNPDNNSWYTLGQYPGTADGDQWHFSSTPCDYKAYIGGTSFYEFIVTPNISGPSVVCTSNETFTISNVLPGSTVTWSVDPASLVETASGTGTTANIKAASSSAKGSATITFTVDGGNDCGVTTISKTFWVGATTITGEWYSYNNSPQYPLQPYYSVPNNEVAEVPAYVTASFSAPGASTSDVQFMDASDPSITWGMAGTEEILLNFDFYDYSQWVIFEVSASNSCGSDTYDVAFYSVEDEMQMYSMSPNPADDQLTAHPRPKSEGKPFEIKLLNDKGEVIRSAMSNGKSGITVDTRTIPEGAYFLHIIEGEKVIKKHVIIAH
jgi:N-acetylneuraminic acid mutarotase